MFLAIGTKRKTRWTYAETNSDFNIWSRSDMKENSKSKTNTDFMKTHDWSHVTHWRSAHDTRREREERRACWIFRFVDSCPSLFICREGRGICLRQSRSSWNFQFCHLSRCSGDFHHYFLLSTPAHPRNTLGLFKLLQVPHPSQDLEVLHDAEIRWSCESMLCDDIICSADDPFFVTFILVLHRTPFSLILSTFVLRHSSCTFLCLTLSLYSCQILSPVDLSNNIASVQEFCWSLEQPMLWWPFFAVPINSFVFVLTLTLAFVLLEVLRHNKTNSSRMMLSSYLSLCTLLSLSIRFRTRIVVIFAKSDLSIDTDFFATLKYLMITSRRSQ